MIVLGIDTSGYINAVGISDGRRVLVDESFPARTDSLEQIVDNIDTTLKKAKLKLKEVEGIGVGLGPGSWTGIKVGVTVGKMLAYSAEKPVYGITTLEALAYTAHKRTKTVCSVISAGVGDTVYAAFFKAGVQQKDFFTGDIKDLAVRIKEPVVMAGSNIEHYRDILVKQKPILKNKITTLEAMPSGAAVACLAAAHLKKGKGEDPLSLIPLYLKESTAKVFVNKYKVKK